MVMWCPPWKSPGGQRLPDEIPLSKFHNLPELMNLFRLAADIQTAGMPQLPAPELGARKPPLSSVNVLRFSGN
ncbi:hypothetical protein [Paenibacillus sp. S150]|uniref:hypothetical protein n=1 Tax=Paenibacillus sp. S150 TaxID=2749826 RepID=UPI001C5A3EFF|nr:hypothetical protein [Paenibacillus sp. S150]MBW4080256.1 hypothetical protein [Paenibacillus sp. S150]